MPTARALTAACVAAALLVGCAGATPGSAPRVSQPGGPGAAVTIQTFQFQPRVLEVPAGSRVTWANQDDIEHTVTAGTPERRDGRFDTPLPGKGASFGVTLGQPGTYPYFCDRHQSMRGEIRVY